MAMKYKVLGKKLNSAESATGKYMTDVERQEADVDCLAYVLIKSAELCFFGESEEYPHMPYLKIYGEVDQIDGEFPFNVKRISFDDLNKDKVHYIYLFNEDQIIRLVRKGLYHKGFKAPASLEGNYIELPIRCHVRAIHPKPSQLDPNPADLMFCGLEHAHAQVTDAQQSGYDLETEFEQMIERPESETDQLQNAMTNTVEETVVKTPMPSIITQKASDLLDYEEEDEPADMDAEFREIIQRIYEKHPNALGYEKKDEIESPVRHAMMAVGEKLRPQTPVNKAAYAPEQKTETAPAENTANTRELSLDDLKASPTKEKTDVDGTDYFF